MLRWLCLLTLSLPLLFWVGHVMIRDGPSPAAARKGLEGYKRIKPDRMDQVRHKEGRITQKKAYRGLVPLVHGDREN